MIGASGEIGQKNHRAGGDFSLYFVFTYVHLCRFDVGRRVVLMRFGLFRRMSFGEIEREELDSPEQCHNDGEYPEITVYTEDLCHGSEPAYGFASVYKKKIRANTPFTCWSVGVFSVPYFSCAVSWPF